MRPPLLKRFSTLFSTGFGSAFFTLTCSLLTSFITTLPEYCKGLRYTVVPFFRKHLPTSRPPYLSRRRRHLSAFIATIAKTPTDQACLRVSGPRISNACCFQVARPCFSRAESPPVWYWGRTGFSEVRRGARLIRSYEVLLGRCLWPLCPVHESSVGAGAIEGDPLEIRSV